MLREVGKFILGPYNTINMLESKTCNLLQVMHERIQHNCTKEKEKSKINIYIKLQEIILHNCNLVIRKTSSVQHKTCLSLSRPSFAALAVNRIITNH